MSDFTHFNDQGRAKMVNVGEKPITQRVAVAAGRVLVNEHTFSLIRSGGMKKGDVLTVAQIAGVMGAKRTPDLIPMCHIVQVEGIDLELHGEYTFISRGDGSGTHSKELSLWPEALGITKEPASFANYTKWYVSANAGMGACLVMAEEMGAYILTDKATFLTFVANDGVMG